MTQDCKRILAVVGTRPEVIKMAPVVHALRQTRWADVRVLATAQHREMLDEALAVFGITPDIDLNIMLPQQSLPELTARLLRALDEVITAETPDAIIVQGDTTTVMAVALAAFYRQIPIGHVEAGLRSGNLYSPFPEEMNRTVAGHLSRWHFAPTKGAEANLLREGIAPDRIHVTGNTVIDALLEVASRATLPSPLKVPAGARMILLTAHRREHFGAPLAEIFRAVRDLADARDDVCFIYPVHPNPNVKETASRLLGDHPRILLCAPIEYVSFVALMKRAYLVITDSGGVQEEAPALGKPVVVTRRETERPEAVTAGVAVLVGPNYDALIAVVGRLLDEPLFYARMAVGASPYGDGAAAGRIVSVLQKDLLGEAKDAASVP
jgi:UDP-N-acetylglucosamine 2-epimerase (non-hydrolysing)